MSSRIRTYSELMRIREFEERFKYLMLRGAVGDRTFGSERWVNQTFYRSTEWKSIRSFVIARDLGCDLAMEGYEIFDPPIVHHMNPMTAEHIKHGDGSILDPEFLITVSHRTHNAIHYGDERLLPRQLIERRPGDTTLWEPIRRRTA